MIIKYIHEIKYRPPYFFKTEEELLQMSVYSIDFPESIFIIEKIDSFFYVVNIDFSGINIDNNFGALLPEICFIKCLAV